jgi:hypothetical protein
VHSEVVGFRARTRKKKRLKSVSSGGVFSHDDGTPGASAVFEAIVAFIFSVLPPTETVIRLSVQPMAAPKPALRIQLLPELKEQEPGNPIPAYLKALLDQDNSSPESNLGPAALRSVDRAARLDKPDWQILLKLKADGIQLLLPDLQKMRELAGALQTRLREEIAQRRYDDAITTTKTLLALARHTGEHPTLIGNLVGVAIATIGLSTLEEMLDKDGCPNLYWALSYLPHPLISLEKGLDGERVLLFSEFRGLSATEPMTAEQIKTLIEHIELIRKFEPDRVKVTTRQWVTVRAKNEKHLEAAKTRLAGAGRDAAKLAKLPADQIVLLDEVREFEERRDESAKYARLSTAEFEKFAPKEVKPSEPALLDSYLFSFRRIRLAQGRVEQRVALLRHIEAIRMYAAEHDGKLPAKLDDIKLPLPKDPFTGEPFRYSVEKDVAHLRGSPPADQKNVAAYNLHYEITIRK